MAQTPRAALKKSGFTEKQEVFMDRYIINGFNATKAAKEAGYSERSAGNISGQLMTKPNIISEIERRMRYITGTNEVMQHRIIEEYKKIAFFDPRQLFTPEGQPKDVSDLPDDIAAVVAGIEIQALHGEGEDGRKTVIGTTRKIRLADKLAALQALSKMQGLFNADESDKPTMPVVNVYAPNAKVMPSREN